MKNHNFTDFIVKCPNEKIDIKIKVSNITIPYNDSTNYSSSIYRVRTPQLESYIRKAYIEDNVLIVFYKCSICNNEHIFRKNT